MVDEVKQGESKQEGAAAVASKVRPVPAPRVLNRHEHATLLDNTNQFSTVTQKVIAGFTAFVEASKHAAQPGDKGYEDHQANMRRFEEKVRTAKTAVNAAEEKLGAVAGAQAVTTHKLARIRDALSKGVSEEKEVAAVSMYAAVHTEAKIMEHIEKYVKNIRDMAATFEYNTGVFGPEAEHQVYLEAVMYVLNEATDSETALRVLSRIEAQMNRGFETKVAEAKENLDSASSALEAAQKEVLKSQQGAVYYDVMTEKLADTLAEFAQAAEALSSVAVHKAYEDAKELTELDALFAAEFEVEGEDEEQKKEREQKNADELRLNKASENAVQKIRDTVSMLVEQAKTLETALRTGVHAELANSMQVLLFNTLFLLSDIKNRSSVESIVKVDEVDAILQQVQKLKRLSSDFLAPAAIADVAVEEVKVEGEVQQAPSVPAEPPMLSVIADVAVEEVKAEAEVQQAPSVPAEPPMLSQIPGANVDFGKQGYGQGALAKQFGFIANDEPKAQAGNVAALPQEVAL